MSGFVSTPPKKRKEKKIEGKKNLIATQLQLRISKIECRGGYEVF